jgi:hypothetical protein
MKAYSLSFLSTIALCRGGKWFPPALLEAQEMNGMVSELFHFSGFRTSGPFIASGDMRVGFGPYALGFIQLPTLFAALVVILTANGMFYFVERYTAQKESDRQSISSVQQEQQTDNQAGKTGTNIQMDSSSKTNWTTTPIVYQRTAATPSIEVATSTPSSAMKTYTNNQFGFIKFNYPGDFSLREERHTVEEATQYKIPLLTVILERMGSYRLDRGTHEYTEVITLGIYDLPASSFHKQTKKIIGNMEWWTSIQTGSEYFMEALTSRGNYTYVFQLHSTKPRWLSFESPPADVLERLLSTVSFQ